MSATAAWAMTDSERARLAAAERLQAEGARILNDLLGMLGDPSWVVRRAVVEGLASIGEPAVEPLCDVLRGPRDDEARLAAAVDALVASRAAVEPSVHRLAIETDPTAVADAALILGRRRSESSIPLLARLTGHPNDNVAVAAVEALGRIGGRASIEALIGCIGSGSFFRVFPAIDILGRSGDPRAVEPLARLLDDPHYLPEAARALGRCGERAGVKPLLALLAAPSDAVARIAISALGELRQRFEEKSGVEAIAIDEMIREQIGPEVIRRLTRIVASADVQEAVALCTILGATGSAEAVPLLARALDGPQPLAMAAAAALKRIDGRADTQLLEALRAGSSVRRKALLPIVSRAVAAPEVAACLADPDPEVRALASEALVRLGAQSAVPQLFALLEDANMRVVHAATAAIQALDTRQGRQLAIRAVRSGGPAARRSALRILSYFGDDDALEPMLEALADPDARVREAALQGLPYLEDARALDALFEAARSAEPRTRALAVRSLGHVPHADERIHSLLLGSLADQEPWVRYYACQSLGRLRHAPACIRIAELLEDPAGQVRVSAVEALSHMDSPPAHDALLAAASSSDLEVRRAALVGLGIANRTEDLPLLLQAASDPDAPTRLMALSAMANVPSPVALGALRAAVTDREEQVRAAAMGFLAARPEREATEALVGLLASDATRERAHRALLVPSEGRIAGLLAALERAGDELAAALVSILARIDRPEALAALRSSMQLGNAAARKAAAPVLAARRDPRAAAILREAAERDPELQVRQICALLLRD